MSDRVWTADQVRDVLVDLLRAQPGAVLASAGEIERMLRWRTRFLYRPADRDLWQYLIAWARARAAGESGSALASARGWARGRYERGFRRASEIIAAGLNAERINGASLLAGEQAEARLLRAGRIRLGPNGAVLTIDSVKTATARRRSRQIRGR